MRRKRDWKPVFLAELARTGNVSAAAAKARIHRDTAYGLRAQADGPTPDPDAVLFAKAWEIALEAAIDALELEARRRAIEGVEEPVGWYKGEAGGSVRRYSDTLLIVLLKAHRPEKYREVTKLEHTGKDGGPIQHEDLEVVRQRRWAQAQAAVLEAAAADPGALRGASGDA